MLRARARRALGRSFGPPHRDYKKRPELTQEILKMLKDGEMIINTRQNKGSILYTLLLVSQTGRSQLVTAIQKKIREANFLRD